MPLKNVVVLVWIIFLSWKVVMTGCEVVLVNRNVTDSFRVGEDGCTKDTSVCTDYGSSCQSDGQCLCPAAEPNFRTPTGTKVYGCLSSVGVQYGIGGSRHCVFGPFQLIPSTRQPDSATIEFTDVDNPNVPLESCILLRADAKFPNNTTEMELQRLDESYVELTIVNNKTLLFEWNKSVLGLRGTIITLHLLCSSGVSLVPKCLRAKILGTWPADVDPVTTKPTVTTTLPKTTSSVAVTTATTEKQNVDPVTTQPTVTSTLPKTTSSVAKTTATTEKQESTSSSTSSSEEQSSESNTLNVALVAPLAISLFVIVVLGIIVGFLWKKVQRMKDNDLKMTGNMIENSKERGTNRMR